MALGDELVGNLDDYQRYMLGGQLAPSQGFSPGPAPLDAPQDPLTQVAEPSSMVRTILDAMRADPAPAFTKGAAPFEEIPNRPKGARELAAQLSAGRNQFDPVEAIIGLGGGPAGGALAAGPLMGQVRGALSHTGFAGMNRAPGQPNFGFMRNQVADVLNPARGNPDAAIAAPYVYNPQRVFAPGIYKDPRIIASEAAQMVAPEHPALKQLFNVTRDDLYEISQQGRRPGNIEPQYNMAANPGGSYAAEGIMMPANAKRLVDALVEAQKYPQLIRGMDPWYVMDPAYQQMERLVGPEQAKRDYVRFNTVGSMFSPASDVETEITRGTAGHQFAAQGRWPEFAKYGGMAEDKRGRNFPPELRDVPGHPYHSTSQAGPVGRYLNTGVIDMSQPKVPLYIQASGVPQTGFQTRLPVPDAHFTRAVGMADVRQNANPGVSMKGPEYNQVGPWFRENVARPLGIEAVPAQARTWGLFAPQTGVDTPIGAGKLELLAKRIWERAQRLGIDPRVLRDRVLRGEDHASLGEDMASAIG